MLHLVVLIWNVMLSFTYSFGVLLVGDRFCCFPVSSHFFVLVLTVHAAVSLLYRK